MKFTTIQKLILDYTTGEITLREFRESFVLLYRESQRSELSIAKLAQNIEEAYGDLIASEIDEDSFRKLLVPLTASYFVTLPFKLHAERINP